MANLPLEDIQGFVLRTYAMSALRVFAGQAARPRPGFCRSCLYLAGGVGRLGIFPGYRPEQCNGVTAQERMLLPLQAPFSPYVPLLRRAPDQRPIPEIGQLAVRGLVITFPDLCGKFGFKGCVERKRACFPLS